MQETGESGTYNNTQGTLKPILDEIQERTIKAS